MHPVYEDMKEEIVSYISVNFRKSFFVRRYGKGSWRKQVCIIQDIFQNLPPEFQSMS